MAKALTLAQTVAAYTKWHVPHKVYGGAATRGRPGGVAPIGITKHHTGGGSASASYLYFLFVTGRPEEGIPGPLCNEATDMGGTVHIGAVGRANHAGSGSAATRDHISSENYTGYASELKPGPDGINGNAIYTGDEIIYSGTRPPTAAAYRASVLSAAARCDAHGWTALSVFSHREHTRRKDDPFGINMVQMRKDIRMVLAAGPKATVTYVANGKLTAPSTDTPAPVTGGNMADWTEAQLRAMMQAENEEYAIRFWITPGGTGTALRNMLTKMNLQLDRIEADTDQAQTAGRVLDADGLLPESRELVNAMNASVADLEARPAATEMQAFLNNDSSMGKAPTS